MVIESNLKDTFSISGSTSNAAVRVSVLNLVDLAGSERAAETQTEEEGERMDKSLMVLGDVINKLCEDGEQRGHIPYRDSKLTHLLLRALGGNAKTSIICTIAPEQDVGASDAEDEAEDYHHAFCCCADMHVNLEEIANLFMAFESGVHNNLQLEGKTYTMIQVEPYTMHGEKGVECVTIMKTRHTLIFGVYEKPMIRAQCDALVRATTYTTRNHGS